jgi:hypothetical protein
MVGPRKLTPAKEVPAQVVRSLTQDDIEARKATCLACELHVAQEVPGFFGKCNAPGRSCAKLAVTSPFEVCRHPAGSKWG